MISPAFVGLFYLTGGMLPEKVRIHKLLDGGGVLKATASDLLSYFFGKSSIKNGSWDKITQGALSERRLSSKAA